MTTDNAAYHISLEWRSEEGSSDDETAYTSSNSSPELRDQQNPPAPIACDGTMIESGSTLRNANSTQTSTPPGPSTAPDSSAPLPTRQGELDPRGYQIELFKRARNENVIAFMDTGTGKTLVAVLLLKKTLEDLKAEEQAERLSRTLQQSSWDSNLSTDVEMTTDDQLPSQSLGEKQRSKKRSREDPSHQLMTFTPKPLPRKARKIVVFLVHRVPLVPQQASYIGRFLSSEDVVGAYYGERGVDDWSSSRWARSLRSKSVLVMTAQIFLNLLRHGLVHIQDVALLIVDEVHHATKSHPYRRIFIEFYHTIKEGDPRPRVFGMTATPVKRKMSYNDQTPYLTAIAELEATLDSTVVVVSGEGQSEIETFVPKPEEFVLTYKSHAESEDEELGEEGLENENQILSRLEQLSTIPCEEQGGNPENSNAECQKMDTSGDTDVQQTGSGNDMVMKGSLPAEDMELVKRIYQKLGYKAATDFATQLCRVSQVSPDITLQTLCEDYKDDETFHKNSIPERVSKLLDIICAGYLRARAERETSRETTSNADRFQCIVFVQERSSALALTWLINSVFAPLKCQELAARSVVGAQNTKNIVRMSRGNLCKTIDDFRQGKYGILVSTSVVEEGLDIPACTLVVAFDPVISPTSYIQGRGRARKKGARYIAFVQQGPREGYEGLCLARRGARIMAEVAKSNIKTEASRQIEEMKNLRAIVGSEKTLFSRTTSARVSATESVNLLHRYCLMKAPNANQQTFQPKYVTSECDGGYLATVTLHSSISLDCGLSAEPQESQVLAKRHAALDAYTKLYHMGEIDEYLLPRRISRSQRMLQVSKNPRDLGVRAFTQRTRQRVRREVASKASKKSKRVRICTIMNPPVVRNHGRELSMEREAHEEISSSERMYLYQISLACDMSSQRWYPSRKDDVFGVLLRDRIESEDEDVIRCPQGDPLFKLSFLKETFLSSKLRDEACHYVRFLQLCLRGRTPGSEIALEIEKNDFANSGKLGFFLLPLTGDVSSDLDVDWVNVQRCTTYGWRCGPQELCHSTQSSSLEHVILCSSHENLDRVYLSGSVRSDLTAEMHHNGLLNSSYSSFLQYFEQRHEAVLKEPRGALLEGFSVREVVTNLSVSPFMLPVETCRVIPVSPLACFITSILPMWQTFLALRTCWRRTSIKSNMVSFLTFARALQPNINNVARKEVDLSYERLEFLGDAVLKVTYSMVTFVKNPDDCEGLLSDERDLEVSNQRLADLALEMRLQDCVAFSGVSQKAKSWPWYWATHQDESIRISEKVLADCVEALIGAHYLHGGVNLALLFLDTHNMLPGANKILGLGNGGSIGAGVSIDIPPMGPGDRRYESDKLHEVEQVIGYKFRDRRHLVVALTHGSFENGLISSYQRYEYLGDAIIGFLLLSHYFDKYPDLSPGELTSIRGPALSNDLFARVIVSCGLHRIFWHNCAPLQKEIDRFAELYANEEDDDDVSKSITVPKVLGDLLESIVGAIVVDKGMRLDGLKEIVLRIMGEELSRFANPDKFKYNPVSELVLLIQQNCNTRPHYIYLENAKNLEKTCIITANKFELGRGVGPTKRVAKRMASISALKKIREENNSAGRCMSSGSSILDQASVGNRASMTWTA